jgi:hypothetical protein
MRDQLTAWLRTWVPGVWGSLIGVLVAHGLLPAELVDQANALSAVVIVIAAGLGVAAYKYVVGLAEPYLPTWLARILLGSALTPTYLRRR